MNRGKGLILLELLLAVGIFVGAALAISGVLRQASHSLALTQDRAVGVDLARSALALIESGEAMPATLQGEVRGGLLDPEGTLAGWSLEVEVDSVAGGLLRVDVTASREPGRPLATLTQVVPSRGGAL